jgi:hypothetical protein
VSEILLMDVQERPGDSPPHLHILAILPNFLVFLFIFLPFRSLAYAVMTQALATMVEVCLSYPVEHRKSSAAGNKNVTYAV